MIIVDIGAGKYKKYKNWLTIYPDLRIYAFEPHIQNYKKISKMRETLSATSAKRLFLINSAVSNDESTRPFYVCRDGNSSSLLPFEKKNVHKWKYPVGHRVFKTIKTIQCKTTTLENIFNRYNIKCVELLNIDTQGNSLEILSTLKSGQYNSIKKIMVKAHTEIGFNIYINQCYSYDVAKFLKRRFFQLFNKTAYSRGQEEILEFINQPMKNRKANFLNLE